LGQPPINISFKYSGTPFITMATQVAVTKWLHTLFTTSWCPGVSEGALKEAISFASICSSQLFLTDGAEFPPKPGPSTSPTACHPTGSS